MASLPIQLLPLILGAVFAPVWVIIVLLLLASPRGLAKAAGFVFGMTLVRLAQGVIFAPILTASPDTKPENGGQSPVVSTLLLVVGILLLITAVLKWLKEDDPDGPPAKWMQSLEQLSPLKALGFGALLVALGPKLWVFTLSALSIISAAELARASSIAAYLIYILLAQIVLIVAVLVYAVAPRAAHVTLQRAIAWLNRYNRPISVAAALIFGLYFTWTGVKGLLS